MMVKIFTLRYSIRLNGIDTTPFDDFIKDKEILEIRDHFFEYDCQPCLALLVFYKSISIPVLPSANRAIHPDVARISLSDADIPLYNTLKEWRTVLAKSKGVPPYIIFNNKQLAAIAHFKPASKTALLKIEGIGDKKTDEYWEELCKIITPLSKHKV